jgi:Skp family chaperone for outer membrane proteins
MQGARRSRALAFPDGACYLATLRRTRRTTLMKILFPALLATAAATTFLPAQDGKTPGAPVEAAAKPAAMVIGVVDLERAADQYPRRLKMKEELQAKANAYGRRLEELKRNLDEEKVRLDSTDEHAEEREDIELRLQLMQQERQALGKRFNDMLRLEEARMMTAIYQDLEAAVKKVAEARGVAIVLRTLNAGPAAADPAKAPAKEVIGRLGVLENRQVWYAAPEVDLTDDLIKLLMVPLDIPRPAPKEPAKDAPKDGAKKDGAADAAKTPAAPKNGG